MRFWTSGQVREMYDVHGEKLRYLVVGVFNTVVSYGMFLLALRVLGPSVHALSDSPVRLVAAVGRNYFLVIQWTVWVLAVPVSTTTMKYFAFRSEGRLTRQVIRAYFVYLPAQGVSSVVLWVTVRLLGFSPQVGQLLTIIVSTIFSYLGHKYFTFKTPLEVGEVPPRELIDT